MSSAATAGPERPRWLPRELHGRLSPGPAGEWRLDVAPGGFSTAARILRAAKARLITVLLSGRPEPALVVLLALRGHVIVLRAALPAGDQLGHEPLGEWWPAARWPERELVERGAIVLIDGDREARMTSPDPDRIGAQVGGADVFAIPYGPIRSGVFEAMQFMIETGGEDVTRLHTRTFFKHRALEERFRALAPDRAVIVAERVAGIASVAHAVAFSQAVERALGVEPPPRARRWRAVVAEIERIANHLDVIARQAEATALFVGQARFQILKEDVLRLQARVTGSRFGRGIVVPGGVRHEAAVALGELREAVEGLEAQFRRDRRLFLGTASMTDRLIGTGRLPRALVEDYGAVGPVARGSGVSLDARHERPYGEYRRMGTVVQTERAGDAMARVAVRFSEMTESFRLLRQAIDHLARRDGPLRAGLPAAGSGEASGWAEAPQGELVYWVELEQGMLERVHIASPSLRNFALFDEAFPKDVLTDFAFIEHSFGLTPAGADR